MNVAVAPALESAQAWENALRKASYVAGPRVALTLLLADKLNRPVLVEGPAGVGKTDLARAAAEVLGTSLVRLQCYEGLDAAQVLYEWDYPKQILATQLLRDRLAKETTEGTLTEAAAKVSGLESHLFSEKYLLERPVLQALRAPERVVLLLDEVDRADPELEAVLLETLAEGQVTVPELGTLRGTSHPLVFLTTNGTREMTDALRRRCLHLFIDYPVPSVEAAIVRLRVPAIEEELLGALTAFLTKVRALPLRKSPSISEAIDWARTLLLLGASKLDPELVRETMGVIVKHDDDREKVEGKLSGLL
jgi:MoxR-like ATPase